MNFITRLFTAITIIAGALVGIITIIANKDTDPEIIQPIKVFGIAITVVSLFLALTYDWLRKIGHMLFYRLQNVYSDFIYNSIYVRIEYLKPDGSLVSYERKDHIVKLSTRRSKRRVTVPVEVEGSIIPESICGLNSSSSRFSTNSILFHCYFDPKNVLNKEHISNYFFQTKDSFKGKNEFWILRSARYARRYTLDIILPHNRKLKNVYALTRVRPKNEGNVVSILTEDYKGWEKVESPLLMIKCRRKHNIISFTIVGLRPTDMYKIAWEFN